MTFAGFGIEAHVWRVDLDRDACADELSWTLSEDERARAARFVFARDRTRFIAARSALRSILGSRVGIPPGELEFEYSSLGKPSLAPRTRVSDLRFNLSHSSDVALVALAQGCELGVDVEQIRHLADVHTLIAREFSAGERAAFERVPVGAQGDAFFRAWVRKEAFLKATGEGLHRSLADVEVTFAPGEPARVIALRGDTSAPRRWSMAALTPRPGYVGALVAAAPAVHVILHEFGGAPVATW
jgi:4'-phosphopantetheinyl transferase